MVALAIALVVLALIADKVGKGHAVMGRNEIHCSGPCASTGGENVGRACHPGRKPPDHAAVATPEAADIVPVAVVPFEEGRSEIAELVPAMAEVPRLGDQDAA